MAVQRSDGDSEFHTPSPQHRTHEFVEQTNKGFLLWAESQDRHWADRVPSLGPHQERHYQL